MKTYYKDFEKQYIGDSDIATLILAGYKRGEGFVITPLCFGQDGNYSAYIVEGEAEIGSHYEKRAEFESWMKVYDDEGLVKQFKGKRIVIYRAAEMGCIIQILN